MSNTGVSSAFGVPLASFWEGQTLAPKLSEAEVERIAEAVARRLAPAASPLSVTEAEIRRLCPELAARPRTS